MFNIKNNKLAFTFGFLLQFLSSNMLIAQVKEVYFGQLNDAINLEMFGATRLLQAGGGEILFLVNSNDDIIIYNVDSDEAMAEFNFEGHINDGISMENGDVIFCGSNELGDGIVKIYTPIGAIKDSLIINNDVPMSILINTNIFYFGTENGVIYSCDNMLNVSKISKLHTSSIYDLDFISNEELAILTATEIYTFRINGKSNPQPIYSCDTCNFFLLSSYDLRLYFASRNNLYVYNLIDKTCKVISMETGKLVDIFLNKKSDKLYVTTETGSLCEYNISDLILHQIINLLDTSVKTVNNKDSTNNTVAEYTQGLSYVLIESMAVSNAIDTLLASTSNTFYIELINDDKALIAQSNGKFTIFDLLENSSIQYQSKCTSVNSMYLTPDKEKFLVSITNTGWNYLQQPEFTGIASSRSSHNINSIIRTYDGKQTVGYYGDSTDNFYQFDVKNLFYDPKKDNTLNVTYINDSVLCTKYSTSKNYPLLTLQTNGSFKVYNKLYKLAVEYDSVISYANVETTNIVFLLKQGNKLVSKTLDDEDEKFIIDLNNISYKEELNSIEAQMEISDNGLYLAILLTDRFYVLDLKTKNFRNAVFVDKNSIVTDFEINNKGRLVYSVINSNVLLNINTKEIDIHALPGNYLFESYYDANSQTLYLIEDNGLIKKYFIQ